MICFASVGDHVIELSKVTHMVRGADQLVAVHFAGGTRVDLCPAEAAALFSVLDGLARSGGIVCVDARPDAAPSARPAPPPRPPAVPVDLIGLPPAKSKRTRTAAAQKASA